ncbi:hypothetical protein, partial [Sphingopyxis sp.]|uniref:hypothetical protein n=1 Tax=Sphingopyxis sp. TaxID=1908224 RepID=UPI0026068562
QPTHALGSRFRGNDEGGETAAPHPKAGIGFKQAFPTLSGCASFHPVDKAVVVQLADATRRGAPGAFNISRDPDLAMQ